MFTTDWRGKGGLVEALFQSSGDAHTERAIPRDDENPSCMRARQRCMRESALTQEAESTEPGDCVRRLGMCMITGGGRGKGGLVEALFQSSGDVLAEHAVP